MRYDWGFYFGNFFAKFRENELSEKIRKRYEKIFFRKSVREKNSAKTMVLLLQQLIAQKPVGIYYSAKLEVLFYNF